MTIEPEEYARTLKKIQADLNLNIEWRGYNGLHFMTKVLTAAGYCYTFNLLKTRDIFNANVLDANYFKEVDNGEQFQQNRNMLSWSLESGYKSNDNYKNYPLRSTEANLQTGATFTYHSVNGNWNVSCDAQSGYKLLLLNPYDWPEVSKKYVQISQGLIYFIKTKPRITGTSNAIRSLQPEV